MLTYIFHSVLPDTVLPKQIMRHILIVDHEFFNIHAHGLEDFTLPHIFQVDSAGVQVIFRSPPGVQVHFFWLGAQPNWHA